MNWLPYKRAKIKFIKLINKDSCGTNDNIEEE